MPHIEISMYPGRDDATKQNLAEKMKQCMIETLGIPEHIVSVSIQDVAPENWADFKDAIPNETKFIEPNT